MINTSNTRFGTVNPSPTSNTLLYAKALNVNKKLYYPQSGTRINIPSAKNIDEFLGLGNKPEPYLAFSPAPVIDLPVRIASKNEIFNRNQRAEYEKNLADNRNEDYQLFLDRRKPIHFPESQNHPTKTRNKNNLTIDTEINPVNFSPMDISPEIPNSGSKLRPFTLNDLTNKQKKQFLYTLEEMAQTPKRRRGYGILQLQRISHLK